jgi:hypothetical protein
MISNLVRPGPTYTVTGPMFFFFWIKPKLLVCEIISSQWQWDLHWVEESWLVRWTQHLVELSLASSATKVGFLAKKNKPKKTSTSRYFHFRFDYFFDLSFGNVESLISVSRNGRGKSWRNRSKRLARLGLRNTKMLLIARYKTLRVLFFSDLCF